MAFLIAQVGALVGALWMFRRNRDDGAWRLDLAVAIGTVAGALLLVIALRIPRVLAGEITLLEGSIAMAYGALGGAALAAFVAARRLGIAAGHVLDALAPALGVMVVAGRSGCFIAGCCYGRPLSWGVTFPAGSPAHADHVRRGLIDGSATTSLAVHPVQLYEVLIGMAMIAVGILLVRKRMRGYAFAAVATVYAAGRFVAEMARDDPRPMSGGLSIAQWLSIVVLALVVVAAPSRITQRAAT